MNSSIPRRARGVWGGGPTLAALLDKSLKLAARSEQGFQAHLSR